MASPRDDLDEQIRRNVSTQRSRDEFAGHRAQVMQLLASAAEACASAAPRLLLLGAGNCNDVDLPQLAGQYAQIHLVDWDAAALERGVAEQQLTGNPRIFLHAPVDLTDARVSLPTAEVVASLCLISQLIEAAVLRHPAGSAEQAHAILSTVREHLRRIVDQLEPGGVGVLVTDFATSQTAPQLATATPEELPKVVSSLLQAGNFFRGLHPGGLFQLLTRDAWFASRVSCQIPRSPWNWQVGKRVYAVSALVMRRTTANTGKVEP